MGEMTLRCRHRLPKPTIAKVDGVAVGVGLGVALGAIRCRQRPRQVLRDLLQAWARPRRWQLLRGSCRGSSACTQAKYLAYLRRRHRRARGTRARAGHPGCSDRPTRRGRAASGAAGWPQGRRSRRVTTAAPSNSSGLSTFEQAVEEEARPAHRLHTHGRYARGHRVEFRERREPNFHLSDQILSSAPSNRAARR